MMRQQTIQIAVFTIALLLWGTSGSANDGRDRYQGPYPTVYYFFDAPISPMAGYRVLTKDMKGGADGDNAFRWARNTSVALVKLAAYRTAKTLGPSRGAMAIFDLSSENGDTPIGFKTGKNPRGRHPGGSHDGGINLDLGYYMTNLKGKHFDPDFAACTNHFLPKAPKKSKSKTPSKKKYRDAYQCLGPADRLDVPRQSYFFLELFKLNRNKFGGDLLEEIGIDQKIAMAVTKQIQSWITSKKYGATAVLLADMKRVFAFSPYEGWSRFHHHHTHLRLRDLPAYGKHRPAFDKLINHAKQADLQLLKRARRGTQPQLIVTLMSYKLRRYLAVKVHGLKNSLKTCNFRLNGAAKWASPLRSAAGCRHEFSLTAGPKQLEATYTIDARLELANGKTITITRKLVTPRRPAYLYVSVKASDFKDASVCRETKTGTSCTLKLSYPKSHSVYVTAVRYKLYRRGGSATKIVAKLSDGYAVKLKTGKLTDYWLVTAEVILSSRYRITIPLSATR